MPFLISLMMLASPLGGAAIAAGGSELKAEAFLSVDKLAPGSRFRVAVVVDLSDPWHINANPVNQPGLIPTTLTLRAPDSIVIERVDYPKGKNLAVSWADKPVTLYSGRVTIFAQGYVRANGTPGPVLLEAALRYQACDDSVCLAPKTLHLSLQTEITTASDKTEFIHLDIFGTADSRGASPAVAPQTDSSNAIDALIQERGWVIALVFVFLGGMALNLTPCVYPMIAITVSYFGGRGERETGSAFAHALAYFIGIVVTYSALGLAAALTGGLFGALLQSTVVLIVIALLLVALALSMFGLYELQPPQFLMQQATGLSSKAGYMGVFFLGATVGIIAAPCIAPILVALLAYVGQRGDPWLGWWMFFTLAAGLGLPYVILGMFSGLLARLPKSGTWMVWVKRVFGVILVAVAVWIVNPLWMPKTTVEGGIDWLAYSPERLSEAATRKQPVIIDFYADWCIPCHEMDKRTFSNLRVIERSREFLMLKADLTRSGSPEVVKVTEEYNIYGVPTTVFIDVNGKEHERLRLIGFLPADDFLKLMNDALLPADAAEPTPAESKMEIPPQLINPF